MKQNFIKRAVKLENQLPKDSLNPKNKMPKPEMPMGKKGKKQVNLSETFGNITKGKR